jgi:hypothetical protein
VKKLMWSGMAVLCSAFVSVGLPADVKADGQPGSPPPFTISGEDTGSSDEDSPVPGDVTDPDDPASQPTPTAPAPAPALPAAPVAPLPAKPLAPAPVATPVAPAAPVQPVAPAAPPQPVLCADGLPPDAGKDGQPGNNACEHHGATSRPPDRALYCFHGQIKDLEKGEPGRPGSIWAGAKPAPANQKCPQPKKAVKRTAAVRRTASSKPHTARPAATRHAAPVAKKTKAKPAPKKPAPAKAPPATTAMTAPPDDPGYCKLDPNVGQIVVDGCMQHPHAFYCLHGKFLDLVQGEPSWHSQYAGAKPAPANQKCPKK